MNPLSLYKAFFLVLEQLIYARDSAMTPLRLGQENTVNTTSRTSRFSASKIQIQNCKL